MPTSTTDQQVADSTNNIEKVANDSRSSSTKMLDEVNKHLSANGFKGNDDASKAVAKKLEQDNVLPKLIIAAFDSDQALKEFGDGTKFDSHKLEDAASGKGEHDSPSERMLAQALLERLKTIDGAGNADGSVTKLELEDWAKKSTDKPVTAQTLSTVALDNIAAELHEAINQKTFVHTNDPDKDKIVRLLDPLSEADRAALEDAYHKKYDLNGAPDTLRRELKNALGGDNSVDWRSTEAVLNRHNGRTNDAGALMVALVEMNSDKDKGNTMLRNVLETLNGKQLADLDKDFREKYGKGYLESINGCKNLSPETKEALPILAKGVEDRTSAALVTLAKIAVKYKDLQMFGESVRGDSKEAQSARAALQSSQEFLDTFAKAFPSDAVKSNRASSLPFESRIDPIALDYLREGQISLATIAANNTNRWIFDNKENVTLAVEHATVKERTDYCAGKAIEEAGTKLSDLPDDKRIQLDYYNRIHSAFKNGGNARETAIWEDILEHGKETIISKMAHSHDDGKVFGILSNTDKEKLFSAVENISEDDWKRLKGLESYSREDAAKFRKELEQALDTYDKDDQARVLKLLDEKTSANTFESSKTFKRTITEVIDDNTGPGLLRLGTTYNNTNIVDQIIHMSPAEASKYKSDQSYRNLINSFVDAHLNVTEQLLIHDVLADVAKTGVTRALSPIDQVLMDLISNASDAEKLKHLENALKDASLRDQLNKPDQQLSEDDQKIKRAFVSVLDDAYFKTHPTESGSTAATNPNLKEYHDQLFKTGELPLALRADLDIPKADLIVQVATASEADRAVLRQKLTAQEQQILDAVISSTDHKLTVADRMRLFLIGDGGNYTDFEDMLDKLHKSNKFDQIQQLKDEYATKYAGDLDNDFLSKVSDKDKSHYKDLLTPANGDGRQSFYDNLKKYLVESGIVFDGTAQTNQRSVDQLASTLAEYQKVYQTLPPEQQKALDAYFNDSLEQYKSSKEKLAELASTALITAASLAVVIGTGGAATPLVMGVAFAAGGVMKVAVARTVEGSDFQITVANIAKQILSGGVAAFSNFVGGELLGLGQTLGTIGKTVAADVITDLGATALKEGGESVLKNSIPLLLSKGAQKITEADLVQLVDQVAAVGSNQVQKELIRKSIEASIAQQAFVIDKIANNSLVEEIITGALESGSTGGAINGSVSAIDDVINGQPIDVQNLLVSSLSGFALGTSVHLSFSGLRGTPDYFTVKKVPSSDGKGLDLLAEPEKGHVQYVKRGDKVYKIDGDKSDFLILSGGDVLLHDVPSTQSISALPLQIELDPKGQLVSVTDAGGIRYTKFGNNWVELYGPNAAIEYMKDVTLLDNHSIKIQEIDAVRTVHADGSSTKVFNSGYTTEYDAAGRVIDVKMQTGYSQHMSYDWSGNLTRIDLELNDHLVSTYRKNTTNWSYYEVGGGQIDVPDVKVLNDGSVEVRTSSGFVATRPDYVQFERDIYGQLHVEHATPAVVAKLRSELENSLGLYIKDPGDRQNFKNWFDNFDQLSPLDLTGKAENYYVWIEKFRRGSGDELARIKEIELLVTGKVKPAPRIPLAGGPIEIANASNSFAHEVEAAYNEIPANVRQFVEAKGLKVVAAGNYYDFNPNPQYSSMHPIGWKDPAATMANPFGLGPARAGDPIYIAEQVRFLDKGNQWDFTYNRREVVFEEVAHAWDRSMNDFSSQAAFLKAYEDDLKNFTPQDFVSYPYYTQGYDPLTNSVNSNLGYPEAGRAEAFAQMFVALQPNTNVNLGAANFIAKFPKVAALMQALVQQPSYP
ncbi:hypothetical protein BH10CYA1_BH10CYA1_26330 [soil metagenome]